uniref:Nuclear cap-binding protein subunit 3 n=1 Tax=Steinernema glaseri TaxID=37863 RepID=A0A1I8AJJ2_9BILA
MVYLSMRLSRSRHGDDELEDLYESLGVDHSNPLLQLQAVVVKSVKAKMADYQVERVFAEFKPESVEPINDHTWAVTFKGDDICASMALAMSKTMKRVRLEKQPEEGEVVEHSDEEEGLVAEEDGDDVYINKRDESASGKQSDYVEVDVEKMKLPSGKWRVVTKHVPPKAMLIFRFASVKDLRNAKENKAARRNQTHKDKDGFVYNWNSTNEKCRPGLNIFDKEGNELDWDYEHDTRFYSDEKAVKDVSAPPTKRSKDDEFRRKDDDGLSFLKNKKIKTKGRGSVRFGGSLELDKIENSNPVRKMVSESVEIGDFTGDIHPDPTPQPWDR